MSPGGIKKSRYGILLALRHWQERDDMRIGISMYATRVAPTFLQSNSMLFAQEAGGEILLKTVVSTNGFTEDERIKKLEELKVQTLICGGIDGLMMEELKDRGIETIQ